MLFEISSTETTGVFDVNAKFMGVSMDKVELVFQVSCICYVGPELILFKQPKFHLFGNEF